MIREQRTAVTEKRAETLSQGKGSSSSSLAPGGNLFIQLKTGQIGRFCATKCVKPKLKMRKSHKKLAHLTSIQKKGEDGGKSALEGKSLFLFAKREEEREKS